MTRLDEIEQRLNIFDDREIRDWTWRNHCHWLVGKLREYKELILEVEEGLDDSWVTLPEGKKCLDKIKSIRGEI